MKQITLKLPQPMLDALNHQAKAQKEDRSTLLRTIISDHFNTAPLAQSDLDEIRSVLVVLLSTMWVEEKHGLEAIAKKAEEITRHWNKVIELGGGQ